MPEALITSFAQAALYMETGRFDKSRRMLDQSELLKPKHVSVLLQACFLSQRRGDFADAERLLYQALHLPIVKVDSASVYEHMTSLYYQQEDSLKHWKPLFILSKVPVAM